MTAKSVTADLPVHPQPVNKIAALHVNGGNKTGREELLWAQREAFDRAMVDARLHQANVEQNKRRDFARVDKLLRKPKGKTLHRPLPIREFQTDLESDRQLERTMQKLHTTMDAKNLSRREASIAGGLSNRQRILRDRRRAGQQAKDKAVSDDKS
jgi:hypothetical protein